MKRLILFITLISISFQSKVSIAQKGISFHVSYNNYDEKSDRFARKDIREFHAFQKKVDEFSYAVDLRKFREAKILKREIIRSMRSEIQDTRKKLRYADNYGYSEGLHQKNRRSGINEYSKRDGKKREVRQLHNQLREQTKLLLKIERLHLDRSRRFQKQGKMHERLMYDFEETLRKDINFSFKDYRYRHRRN